MITPSGNADAKNCLFVSQNTGKGRLLIKLATYSEVSNLNLGDLALQTETVNRVTGAILCSEHQDRNNSATYH